MRRLSSIILAFIMLFSSVVYDYNYVQADETTTQTVQPLATQFQGVQPLVATDTSASISFASDGNLTKPVVTATINTGGKKIVGITYDRGYNQTATGTSKRIYGYEGQSGTVSVKINDVYKHVSVYVVLADANNVKTEVVANYTLPGTRVYNQSNDNFAPYPVTPLNDDTNKSTLIMDKVGVASATDNGPMIVVDDEVWVFGDSTQFDVYKMDDIDGYFGTTTDIAKKNYNIASRRFIEYGTSIVYDGRYVIGINETGGLMIFDATTPTKQYADAAAEAIIKGYSTFGATGVSGLYGNQGVQNIIYDNNNLYFASYSGNLYKATPNNDANGTYTLSTTSLGKFKPNAGHTVYTVDMVYDGANLWTTDATTNLYKASFNGNTVGAITTIPLGAGNVGTSVVYDGSNYIYTLLSKAQVGSGTNNGLAKIDKGTNAVTRVYTDSIASVASHEDISFDGRNIYILAYNESNTNLQRYDTVNNKREVLTPAQVMDGPAGDTYRHNINGVFDGKYQWFYRYSDRHINILGRKLDLKFGTTGAYGSLNKDLTRGFDDPKVTDPTTTVYVDEKETTSPNYVTAKTTSGKSTSNIVFGAWTFDTTAAAAATRNDAFFKDLTKAIDTEAMDPTDWTSYRNHVGEYFTLQQSELPTVSGGTFNYALKTLPKQNGYYTLYFVNAEGRPYYETLYVDNYKELTRLYINFEDKDTHEVIKQMMDDTFAMGSSATVKYATYAAELAAEGYELADTATKTTTMDTASKEMTFIVAKDKTKWTEIIYKPYYINNSGTRVELGEVKSGKYYLVNDPYKDGDATTLAKYNRKANIDATHIDKFRIDPSDPSPREVAFPSTAGGTKTSYGRTEVAFKYLPEKSVVVEKGIGVDVSGNPTGEVAYSTVVTGNEGDVVDLRADTLANWTYVGLATVDGSGNVTSIDKTKNSFKATYGYNDVVYFAYTHNSIDINVEYINKNTNAVIGTDKFAVEQDDNITLVAKEFDGFALSATDGSGNAQASTQVVKATTVNGAKVYKFYYEPIGTFINVKGIEVDAITKQPTGNIVYTKQVTGEDNQTTTATADEGLVNWTLVGLANYDGSGNFVNVTNGTKTKNVEFGKDREVTFAYTRNMATVTVEYLSKGVKIATDETFTIPLNTEFTGIGKAIEGYKLTDAAAYKNGPSIVNTATKTISFNYTPIKETVTVEVRLGNPSGTVLARGSKDFELGATDAVVNYDDVDFGFDSMLAPRYVLDETKTPKTFAIPSVNETTVVTYIVKEQTQTVTVNFVEKVNPANPVATTKTYTIPYGTKYSEYAISVDGYYIDTPTDALSYKDNTADSPTATYTFRYTKAAGDILVMAKDDATGAILEYKVYSGSVGSALTFDVSQFSGSWKPNYTIKAASPTTQSLNYTSELQTMVFLYNRDTYTVTIDAKEDSTSGAPLSFFDGSSSKVFTYYKNDKFSIYAPPVDGYVVKVGESRFYNDGNAPITGNKSFTFVYEKIDTDVVLAVKLATEDGSTIIGGKTVVGTRKDIGQVSVNETTGTVTATKTTEAGGTTSFTYDKNVWQLVDSGNSSKNVTYGKDYSVEFRFKRVPTTLTINYWNGTSSGSATLLDTETKTVGVGTVEKAVSKIITDYQLQDAQAPYITTVISNGSNVVDFYYKPVTGNTIVYARDKVNNVILEKKIVNQPVGSTYDASIIRNTFMTDKDGAFAYDANSVTTTTIDSDVSKNIIYLDYTPVYFNVTINYQDEQGNTLDTTKSYTVAYGSTVTEYATNIPFYNLLDGQEVSKTFTNITADQTYTFKYEAILIPDGVINLIAVDSENGNKILDMVSVRGAVGTEENFDIRYYISNVPGYQIADAQAVQKGVFVNGYANIQFPYTPIKHKITIQALDGTTNKLINFDSGTQTQFDVKEHDSITLYAPHIEGYILTGDESITIDDVTKGQTVQFTYKTIDEVVVVKAIEVDATGKPVIKNGIESVVYTEVVGGDKLTTTNVAAKYPLTNWTFVGLVNYDTNGAFTSISNGVDNKNVKFGTDEMVVFGYTRKTNTVTVKYLEEGTGNVVATQDAIVVPSNTDITITAKAVEGYELTDFNNYKESFLVTGDVTKTFVYKKLEKTVKIEARLGSPTGTLLAQYTENLPLGSKNVNVTADKISALISPRYALETSLTPNVYTISEVKTDTVVTYVYKEQLSTITVNYLSGATNSSIMTSKTYTVPYGTKIVESAASVKDYYLDTTKSQPTQTVASAVQPTYTMDFIYARSNGDISVIAKDAATGEILFYKTHTGTQGSTLNVTETSEFKGQNFLNYYQLSPANPGSQSLTYTNAHQEMVFNYQKQTYTVSLKAVEVGTTSPNLNFYNGSDTIVNTYTKGDKYEIYAPPVDGYYVNPSSPSFIRNDGITSNVEHTFIYKKVELNTNINIKAVSSPDGEYVLGSKTVSNERGTAATIAIADHPDLYKDAEWTLTSPSAVDVVFGTDKEAIFKFTRKTVNITVRHLDATNPSDVKTLGIETATGIPTNTSYTAVANLFDNYELEVGQAQSQTIDTGTSNKVIDFVYVLKDGNVIIEAVDPSGKILARKYTNAQEGQSYVVESGIKTAFDTALVGYKYDTNSIETISSVSPDAKNNIIKLVYIPQYSNIKVKYVDTNGAEISLPKEYQVQYGRGFDEYAKNVPFYNLVTADSHVSYKNVNQPSIEVVYVYSIDDGCIINVIAKSTDGKILGLESFIGTLDSTVEFDSSKIFGQITGYKLLDDQVKTARYTTGLVNVVFVYDYAGLTVSIKAIDRATNKELPFSEPATMAVQAGSTFNVYAPHVTAYAVEGSPIIEVPNITEDTTIFFFYNKVAVPAKIVSKHISYVNGHEVLIKSDIIEGYVGETLNLSPLSQEEQATLGFKIQSNYDVVKPVTLGLTTDSKAVFVYDRDMSTLNLNHNTNIYADSAAVQNNVVSRTLGEVDKRTLAPQLLNRSIKVEVRSHYTVMAPFESEYVINSKLNTEALRQNVNMADPVVTKNYQYRNITGNVLVRAVVADEKGTLVINGKRYTPLAQLDDNSAVGVKYTNAPNVRDQLEAMLSPAYRYDPSQGLISGIEEFVPKSTDTYKDHTLTYVFTADYKEVNVEFRDTDGNLIQASMLGIDSNPLKVLVVNGDYYTQYALNINNYNFRGSSISKAGVSPVAATTFAARSASTPSTLNGLNGTTYYNEPITSDTTIKFVYELDNDFIQQAIKTKVGNNVESKMYNIVAGQTIFAPYIDGYKPSPSQFIASEGITEYVFEYEPVAKEVVVKNIYNEYTKTVFEREFTDRQSYIGDAVPFTHKAYVLGYGDSTVKPNGTFTRAEGVSLLYNLLHDGSKNQGTVKIKFSDVSESAWYYDMLVEMASYGYVTGYEDGTFRPNDAISREEIAAVLSRIYGTGKESVVTNLPLDTNGWATEFILDCYISGFYDDINITNMVWTDDVTRAEVMVMANNATGRVPHKDLLTMDNVIIPSDLGTDHWAYLHIIEAMNNHEGHYEGNFGEEREVIYFED